MPELPPVEEEPEIPKATPPEDIFVGVNVENEIIDEAPPDTLPVEIQPIVKIKKPKSQKQLDHLAKIRQKSLEARKLKKEAKVKELKDAIERPPRPIAPVAQAPVIVQNTPPPMNFIKMEDVENIITRRLAERDSKKAVARAEAIAKNATAIAEKNAEKAILDKKIAQKEMAMNLIRPNKGARGRRRGNFY